MAEMAGSQRRSAANTPQMKISWADLSEDLINSDVETESARSSWADLSEDLHSHVSLTKMVSSSSWANLSDDAESCVADGPNSSRSLSAVDRSQNSTQPVSEANTGFDNRIPPDAVGAFNSTQVSGNVVIIEGLPLKLCSDACLEVMLNQAQVQDNVLNYEVEKGQKVGVVRVQLSDWFACQRCYSHFAGNCWSGAKLRVRVEADAAAPPMVEPQVAWPTWDANACCDIQNWCFASPTQCTAGSVQDVAVFGCQNHDGNSQWVGQFMAPVQFYNMIPYASNFNRASD